MNDRYRNIYLLLADTYRYYQVSSNNTDYFFDFQICCIIFCVLHKESYQNFCKLDQNFNRQNFFINNFIINEPLTYRMLSQTLICLFFRWAGILRNRSNFNKIWIYTKYYKIICLTCKKGHNLHINAGKSHRFNNAAWNWNGIQNVAIITSAQAKLAM